VWVVWVMWMEVNWDRVLILWGRIRGETGEGEQEVEGEGWTGEWWDLERLGPMVRKSEEGWDRWKVERGWIASDDNQGKKRGNSQK